MNPHFSTQSMGPLDVVANKRLTGLCMCVGWFGFHMPLYRKINIGQYVNVSDKGLSQSFPQYRK